MNKITRNVLIVLLIIIIAAAIGFYLDSLKETVEFEEFTIEAPMGSDFENLTPSDDLTVKEQYRSMNDDLTITSFNKQYIEDEYYSLTGEMINYTEMLMDHLSEDESYNITKISDNLTSYIFTANINGYEDTDVAILYTDENHIIMVEGGDVEFITEIANSIKIL